MPIKHALKLIDYAKYLQISLTVKSVILDMKSTQMENVRRVKMCSVWSGITKFVKHATMVITCQMELANR